jgi:hypothetical protein
MVYVWVGDVRIGTPVSLVNVNTYAYILTTKEATFLLCPERFYEAAPWEFCLIVVLPVISVINFIRISAERGIIC